MGPIRPIFDLIGTYPWGMGPIQGIVGPLGLMRGVMGMFGAYQGDPGPILGPIQVHSGGLGTIYLMKQLDIVLSPSVFVWNPFLTLAKMTFDLDQCDL